MDEWARHWSVDGDGSIRRADAFLEADNLTDAGRGYLLASQCYWLALSSTTLGMPERRRLEDAHVGAFRAALPSLPHAATPFALHLGDLDAAGYLFMPADRVRPSVTVVWPVGGCATPESAYWQLAAPLLGTGAACVVFAADTEQSVHAVVQWVRQQPGVDHVLAVGTTPPSGQAV